MKISWTFGPTQSIIFTVSEATKETPSISTNRFFLYIALGILAFILVIVGLGATLTQVLWPIDQNLSHPVMTPEEKI